MVSCHINFALQYELDLYHVTSNCTEVKMTKSMAAMLVNTTKECKYNSIVIVHQHGGYDVTSKPRISATAVLSVVQFEAKKMNKKLNVLCS